MTCLQSFSPSLKITPKLAEKLDKLGLRTDQDVLLHIPLRYEDETHITPVADLRLGVFAQAQVTVVAQSVQFRGRRSLLVTTMDAAEDTLVLRFLNFYPNTTATLKEGALVRVQGEPRMGHHGVEMVHPRFQGVREETPLSEHLSPVYPTTEGLSQGAMRKLMAKAMAEVSLPEILPEQILDDSWPTLNEAVRLLHAPPPDVNPSALTERDHPAWSRIKFEELLAQQISLTKAKLKRAAEHAPPLLARNDVFSRFVAQLPFALTGAQQRAWALIAHDVTQGVPMHRLLQGDVGSGKTVVAGLACAQCVAAGFQAAVMAPTEILAEQLFEKLRGWFEPLGMRVVWLASSVKKKDKQTTYEAIRENQAHVVVGTHALIQEAVQFYNLGLAVIDEQHRFGVMQRLELRHKMRDNVSMQARSAENNGVKYSEHAPHQLMMSATPIPRTLALSYFADLDVAVIDELPPNRTPIITKLIDQVRRGDVVDKVARDVSLGRQVYWVCPLIEESETLELQTAIDTHATLVTMLPDVRIGLVHGRLSAAEKRAVMQAFVAHELDVLVATTVIEVGVDVANASVMVIEHAERFGLAQLHQLRGRVGRGATQSTCILLYEKPLSATAKSRLKTMYETTDGFEVARQDLLLRGAGEFLGTRQSGLPLLRFADIEKDIELLELARDAAAWLLKHNPDAADAHLQRWLAQREHYLAG
ncbi:ATP-dependent DNA helicase RecG [Ephemeroptericola cinctiostellae]|uniref:ATP-dependent DNA helicase RecG n=1 Tax=Ephemeroptericola cinctiostellae TaxID=2268024 RepID=A0A345D7K7_9BURK|nr:ATP-dependent DNA helicase RecG [Ephemeroptericola cinctiostellae]AXF84345.1 ATP-dependent DNA helicase RecG [Ephemeroptericola cinctiostellae]